jgi:hypothetical protein
MNENTIDFTSKIANRGKVMRPRNGSVGAIACELFFHANETYNSVRVKRTAAWSFGMPADASDWPFVVRTLIGPPDPYEGLEVCTGAALAAKYARAHAQDESFVFHVWALLDLHLCPVWVDWDRPTLEYGSMIRIGWITVGDTRIGRLSYLLTGADA